MQQHDEHCRRMRDWTVAQFRRARLKGKRGPFKSPYRPRAEKASALRPYDGLCGPRLGPNGAAKAVEYARWLAARDGVDLSCLEVRPHVRVMYEAVQWAAHRQCVFVATAVRFGREDDPNSVTIELPNWNFDPTAPAVEVDDLAAVELPLAA